MTQERECHVLDLCESASVSVYQSDQGMKGQGPKFIHIGLVWFSAPKLLSLEA